MAKGDVTVDGESESVGSKIGTFILIILILIVWLAIFALLIKMDVAGIGTTLRPSLKDVPALSWILPEVSDEQLIYENDYPYRNIKEAVEVIKAQERTIDDLNATNEEYAKKILEQQAEIDRLKHFEEEYEDFEARVREFDINVVYNSKAPDIDEYKKYYERINPVTAAEIYRQVIEQLEYEDSVKEKADLLKNMKPANAAKVLEEMTADIEYSCKLLLCMKTTEATAIIDKMDTLFAARILQKMHDMDDEWYERIQENRIDKGVSD